MRAETELRSKISSSITESIGQTPLVNIQELFPQSRVNIYAKLESSNPAGSLKDRTSTFIIKKALETGLVKEGDIIVESSSGNMA